MSATGPHAPRGLETTLSVLLFILVPSLLGGLLAGWAVHRLARRHLDARRAKWFAVGAFLAVALGWYLTSFIAAVGVIGAVIVYFIARAWLGSRRALYSASATYLVFTVCVGGMLYVALDSMG